MGEIKKLGLALGSGGAKGLAHIGVLKVLEKEKIPVEFIAGSSIGALVGGLYACFRDAKKLEELAFSMKWKELLSLIDPALRKGLIRGKRVSLFLEKQLGKKEFKDLPLPFKAVATDLLTGERVILEEGELALAIRASGAYPLVFQPVPFKGRLLVDGGLSCPVPAEVVRDMGADVVLAVNLDSEHFKGEGIQNNISFRRIANNSINALRFHLARENARWADVVVSPRVGVVGWEKFTEPGDLIPRGEEAMKEQLPLLFTLLKN